MKYNFTKWARWRDRKGLPGIRHPGIYVIAKSRKSLSGKNFSWMKGIIYIGMTGGKSGLRGRLGQFERTLKVTKPSHGGAHRVRSKYKKHSALLPKLYVAIMPSHMVKPAKIRALETAKLYGLELFCLSEYIRRHNSIPEFNDWGRSPKI